MIYFPETLLELLLLCDSLRNKLNPDKVTNQQPEVLVD